MRKYKFRQHTVKDFFAKHGFKLAVTASVLGLGIAAYSAIGTVNDILTPQPGGNTSKPVENLVSGITGDGSDLPSESTSEDTSSAVSEPESTDSKVTSSESAPSEKEPEPSKSDEPEEPEEPETPTFTYPEYFYLPVNGKVGKEFSDSTPVFSATMGDWRVHNGADFAAEKGERVIAAADGVVTDVRYDEAWGWVVDVDHGGGLAASYRNLNDDVQVETGDILKAGQLIAGIGEGGYEECDDGTHLHLEMTLDGKFVDPVTVMNKKTA